MRDAFVAALSLNIFNKYGERLHMANIAQIANVLQSIVLTKDDKMLLTPTYHVFEMYKVHQDATHLPLYIIVDKKEIRERQVDMVNVSASKKDGKIYLTLANIDLDKERNIEINFANAKTGSVSGRILTSPKITDHNTFEKPDIVKPVDFKDAKLSQGKLSVKLPAKSIVVLEVK